ncbi:MAG: hypothetical protein Q8Q89_00795 [bacterium]|nr:hypothetical protein [bacterium]
MQSTGRGLAISTLIGSGISTLIEVGGGTGAWGTWITITCGGGAGVGGTATGTGTADGDGATDDVEVTSGAGVVAFPHWIPPKRIQKRIATPPNPSMIFRN